MVKEFNKTENTKNEIPFPNKVIKKICESLMQSNDQNKNTVNGKFHRQNY